MECRAAGSAVRKGSWTEEEDVLLRKCIEKYGEGKWRHVPSRAGLNRCRKSCRLRWLNYLRPNLKRGQFAQDEVDLIIRMHKLLGNRWALIAGRLPGRTANDVKNYWNSHLNKISVSKKVELLSRIEDINSTSIRIMEANEVIKPHPLSFSKNSQWSIGNNHSSMETCIGFADMLISKSSSPPSSVADLDIRDESMVWLENILLEKEEGEEEEEKITTSSSSSMGVVDVEMELGNGSNKGESFVGQCGNDWELYVEGNDNGNDLWHLLLPQLEK